MEQPHDPDPELPPAPGDVDLLCRCVCHREPLDLRLHDGATGCLCQQTATERAALRIAARARTATGAPAPAPDGDASAKDAPGGTSPGMGGTACDHAERGGWAFCPSCGEPA